MRRILDFRFWILDWRQGRERLLLTFSVFLFQFSLIFGCASAPVYPDPRPGEGQILVEVKGVPREGVKGPARETVREEYSSHSESVEKGKAFERVKYDDLVDVVAVLERADGGKVYTGKVSFSYAIEPDVTISQQGFSRAQCSVTYGGADEFAVENELNQPATLLLWGQDGSLHEVVIEKRELGLVKVPAGIYAMTCEQVETATCRLFATDAGSARTVRNGRVMFDDLKPGDYEVAVYAPRLPEFRRKVTVTAGKRETVVAELTVNHMPRAR